jgi:hypothetical protein
MWKTIALLWLIPVATALLIAARVTNGRPAVNADERLWLLGDDEEIFLSPWLWIKFGALLVLFFTAGLLQALVVINLGGWLMALPLLTGLAAMFVVFHWLH